MQEETNVVINPNILELDVITDEMIVELGNCDDIGDKHE